MTRSSYASSAGLFGIVLIVLGAWVAAAAFYAALLPWQIGVWTETEPMVLAMHAAALLCTVGIAVCAALRPRLALPALTHPAVLAAGFVAVWTLAAAPFVDLPVLSLLGAPQLGEGGLYYAEGAVLLASGMLLVRLPLARRLFLFAGILACVGTPIVVAVATHLDPAQPWWLFRFNDYLAWYALIGASLALGLRLRRQTVRFLVALLVALPGLAVSGNNSAVAVLVLVACPAAVLAAMPSQLSAGRERRLRRGAALAVPLLVVAGLVAVWVVGEAGLVASLVSRLYMFRTLLAGIAEDPVIFLVGHGWGQINTLVLMHLADSGAVIWDGSWDLSSRDIPHSHNFAVEALMGAGIPAALATVCMLASLPLLARHRDLPSAVFTTLAVAGVGALWFQLPATSGLTWLALGFAAGSGRWRQRPWRGRRFAMLAVLCVLAAAQAVSFYWLADYALSARRAAADGYRVAGDRCGAFPDDSIRGSLGLAQQFDHELQALFANETRTVSDSEAGWADLQRLHCLVTRRADARDAPRLMLADLLFRGEIANVPQLAAYRPLFADALRSWRVSLAAFVATVPGRSEVAAPYMTWLLNRNEAGEVVGFSEYLLARNPDDPIGHWFLGVGLSGLGGPMEPARARRIVGHMQRALDLGVARLIKVDPALVRFIDGMAAGDPSVDVPVAR